MLYLTVQLCVMLPICEERANETKFALAQQHVKDERVRQEKLWIQLFEQTQLQKDRPSCSCGVSFPPRVL